MSALDHHRFEDVDNATIIFEVRSAKIARPVLNDQRFKMQTTRRSSSMSALDVRAPAAPFLAEVRFAKIARPVVNHHRFRTRTTRRPSSMIALDLDAPRHRKYITRT